jgi:hypothetical protein
MSILKILYNRLYSPFRGRKEEVNWSEGSLGYGGKGDSNKSVDQLALAVRGYAQNAGRERERIQTVALQLLAGQVRRCRL